MLSFKQYTIEATNIGISRTKLMREINGLTRTFVDKEVTIAQATKYLREVLTSILDCKVSYGRSPGVSSNTINVIGYYDAEKDEDGEEPFEFVIMFNPKDTKVAMSKNYWNWFKNELADAIMHEMTHQGQQHARGFGVDSKEYKGKTEDQSYYGNRDEIEAYAMNAANELNRAYLSTKSAIKALAKPYEIGEKSAPSLQRYIEAFQSTDHPIMKVFLKKVYQFLQTVPKRDYTKNLKR